MQKSAWIPHSEEYCNSLLGVAWSAGPNSTVEKLETQADGSEEPEPHLRLVGFLRKMVIDNPKLKPRYLRESLWLIERYPDCSETVFSMAAHLVVDGEEARARIREAWLSAVDRSTRDTRVVLNASRALQEIDEQEALRLVEQLIRDHPPGNPEWWKHLGDVQRSIARNGHTPPDHARLLDAVAAYRTAREHGSGGDVSFSALTSLVLTLQEAGNDAEAATTATELLAEAPQWTDDWNYGNAIFRAHMTLSRVAFHRKDMDAAARSLIAASQTPGSPQLDAFGPDRDDLKFALLIARAGRIDAAAQFMRGIARFNSHSLYPGLADKLEHGQIPDDADCLKL
jgi:tetratricopeptide (TPR) repeat protein